MNVNIELSPGKRKLVMFSVLIQQFAFLVISFGNGAAMPAIVESLGQSEYYAFVGVVYSLSQAIIAPIAATIGDRVGRKWINAGSLVLMCVFLILAYFSTNFVMLLIAWFLCGAAIGGFMSGPFLIMMDIYEQKDWGKMSANIVTALSLGMIVGPVVTGMLVDAGYMRMFFLLPIPFFIIASAIQFALYPNKRREGGTRFDAPGVIYLVLALVPFVVILNFAGSMFPWASATTLLLAAVTVIALVLLIRRETRTEFPAFPIGALKNRIILLCALICFLASAYSVLTAGFLIYFAQVVLQASATSGSTLLLPQVIVSMILPQFVGRWAGGNQDRYRLALAVMGVLFAVTLGGISMMKAGSSMVIFYALMAVGGIGYTFLNNLMAPFVSMNVDRSQIGAANGLKSFFTTLGTAVMGSVFGLILGLFENFATALAAAFVFGAVCCLIVTPLTLVLAKKKPE